MACGKIYKHSPEFEDEALKRFSTGLSICDNVGVFESPSECRIWKAKFLKEIGAFYADKLSKKNDPLKKMPP